MLETVIFAKKRVTKEGKTFYVYLTRLEKKNGEIISANVKFADTANTPQPEDCPMNIILERGDCNMSARKYTRPDTGEIVVTNTLWVKRWKKSENAFEDHSMDEFF